MARINIEDSLFRENSFIELAIKLGSRRNALGALVEAFILAQEYYLKLENDRLIPKESWKRQKICPEIIEVGLAEERENGIYVFGSNEQFSWLVQKSEAGKKGRAPKKEIVINERSTYVNERSTSDNGSDPLTLTPTLTHSSSTTTESSEIPSDILTAIKTTMQYPDEIIEDTRKDAWIKYLAKENPEKNWKRFISHYIVNEKETIRNLAIDRGKVVKKPTQNNQARDMASKIYTQVLRNGMHGLRDTLKSLSPLEVSALDRFGLASEIISCPSDFQATEIKNRLKAACEEAIKLRSGEVDISFQGEQGNNFSKVGG